MKQPHNNIERAMILWVVVIFALYAWQFRELAGPVFRLLSA